MPSRGIAVVLLRHAENIKKKKSESNIRDCPRMDRIIFAGTRRFGAYYSSRRVSTYTSPSGVMKVLRGRASVRVGTSGDLTLRAYASPSCSANPCIGDKSREH